MTFNMIRVITKLFKRQPFIYTARADRPEEVKDVMRYFWDFCTYITTDFMQNEFWSNYQMWEGAETVIKY